MRWIRLSFIAKLLVWKAVVLAVTEGNEVGELIV